MPESIVPAPSPAASPSEPPNSQLTQPAAETQLQTWEPPAEPADGEGFKAGRYVAALKRYKWLIMGIALIGTAGGVVASRLILPKYEVQAKLWIAEAPSPRGPIQSDEFLSQSAYSELIRSFAILEPVVTRQHLYILPKSDADSLAFQDFAPSTEMRPGRYAMTIDKTARTYTLIKLATRDQHEVEHGSLGDSVGRAAGFKWSPPISVLENRRRVEFTVLTPRDAAVDLNRHLVVQPPPVSGSQTSNFMTLRLGGTRPQQLAATMNALMNEFVTQAEALKKRSLTEFRKTLSEQLDIAERNMQTKESALEVFKAKTATEPRENISVQTSASVPVNPALADFFTRRVQYENIKRDREALQRVISEASGGPIEPEALLGIPTVFEASPNLQTAVKELTSAQATLRALREKYTDEAKPVQTVMGQIAQLESQIIPTAARSVLAQLQRQETDLKGRLEGASAEIREIPQRTIQEQAMTRERDIAATLYSNLATRKLEAQLAEAGATPDVSILDPAVAPDQPSSDTAPRLLIMIIGVSMAGGVALAILLDLLDKRFRYPEQATQELGLDILGGVPSIKRTLSGRTRVEDASQLVESFRALRLGVRSACEGTGPIALTITSPGPGDGKSLISSNLALSFAEAGFRTLLVDGDIRRGQLHTLFGLDHRPGLVDYLTGEATLQDTIRETSHANLHLIPCGVRKHRGPELLASEASVKLLRDLKQRYDCVIVDSSPLGAGVDPYALGAATGNIALVLRTGKTDRKLAQAKLTTLDRLPVRIVGAVLNDIAPEGSYKYYAYLDGYGTVEDEEGPKAIGASGRELASGQN